MGGISVKRPFHVVDLFAGPGGLAEGFEPVGSPMKSRKARIVLSVEKDAAAHRTLRFRAFLRQFGENLPAEYYHHLQNGTEDVDAALASLYPQEWAHAENEAWHFEMASTPEVRDVFTKRLQALRKSSGDRLLVIGGPPCQAYSLVGRSRNKGNADYDATTDVRHVLYEEYIAALETVSPVAFVMENVKGLISSKLDGENIIHRILDDLRSVGNGYTLLTVTPPRYNLTRKNNKPGDLEPVDFVVRAEQHGVPQARHRVLIVGVRNDHFHDGHTDERLYLKTRTPVSVAAAIGSLPSRFASLSARSKNKGESLDTTLEEARSIALRAVDHVPEVHRQAFRKSVEGAQETLFSAVATLPTPLTGWLCDPKVATPVNHDVRTHMGSDLQRYFYASCYAQATGVSPKAVDFPSELAPAHRSWKSGNFPDRFRVQLAHQPSTTVTAHISKDGHAFIHPDPGQCRSLTVREAARLQTFPDNYLFLGTRTQQYVQVGNAVPPYLAHQIATALLHALVPPTPKRRPTKRSESKSGDRP